MRTESSRRTTNAFDAHERLGRAFIPELRKRWPTLTSIELSDRTTPSEIELLRAISGRGRVRHCRNSFTAA
jgi:hypothetical protein